jgi:co-chaperonin GroES (HSP10)
MTLNQSGMHPYQRYVLLRADAPKNHTKGGVLLTSEQHDDKSAVIVEVGPDAFRDWTGPFPTVGDRVLHFGAIEITRGPDGEKYWLCVDEKLAVKVDAPSTLLKV